MFVDDGYRTSHNPHDIAASAQWTAALRSGPTRARPTRDAFTTVAARRSGRAVDGTSPVATRKAALGHRAADPRSAAADDSAVRDGPAMGIRPPVTPKARGSWAAPSGDVALYSHSMVASSASHRAAADNRSAKSNRFADVQRAEPGSDSDSLDDFGPLPDGGFRRPPRTHSAHSSDATAVERLDGGNGAPNANNVRSDTAREARSASGSVSTAAYDAQKMEMQPNRVIDDDPPPPFSRSVPRLRPAADDTRHADTSSAAGAYEDVGTAAPLRLWADAARYVTSNRLSPQSSLDRFLADADDAAHRRVGASPPPTSSPLRGRRSFIHPFTLSSLERYQLSSSSGDVDVETRRAAIHAAAAAASVIEPLEHDTHDSPFRLRHVTGFDPQRDALLEAEVLGGAKSQPKATMLPRNDYDASMRRGEHTDKFSLPSSGRIRPTDVVPALGAAGDTAAMSVELPSRDVMLGVGSDGSGRGRIVDVADEETAARRRRLAVSRRVPVELRTALASSDTFLVEDSKPSDANPPSRQTQNGVTLTVANQIDVGRQGSPSQQSRVERAHAPNGVVGGSGAASRRTPFVDASSIGEAVVARRQQFDRVRRLAALEDSVQEFLPLRSGSPVASSTRLSARGSPAADTSARHTLLLDAYHGGILPGSQGGSPRWPPPPDAGLGTTPRVAVEIGVQTGSDTPSAVDVADGGADMPPPLPPPLHLVINGSNARLSATNVPSSVVVVRRGGRDGGGGSDEVSHGETVRTALREPRHPTNEGPPSWGSPSTIAASTSSHGRHEATIGEHAARAPDRTLDHKSDDKPSAETPISASAAVTPLSPGQLLPHHLLHVPRALPPGLLDSAKRIADAAAGHARAAHDQVGGDVDGAAAAKRWQSIEQLKAAYHQARRRAAETRSAPNATMPGVVPAQPHQQHDGVVGASKVSPAPTAPSRIPPQTSRQFAPPAVLTPRDRRLSTDDGDGEERSPIVSTSDAERGLALPSSTGTRPADPARQQYRGTHQHTTDDTTDAPSPRRAIRAQVWRRAAGALAAAEDATRRQHAATPPPSSPPSLRASRSKGAIIRVFDRSLHSQQPPARSPRTSNRRSSTLDAALETKAVPSLTGGLPLHPTAPHSGEPLFFSRDGEYDDLHVGRPPIVRAAAPRLVHSNSDEVYAADTTSAFAPRARPSAASNAHKSRHQHSGGWGAVRTATTTSVVPAGDGGRVTVHNLSTAKSASLKNGAAAAEDGQTGAATSTPDGEPRPQDSRPTATRPNRTAVALPKVSSAVGVEAGRPLSLQLPTPPVGSSSSVVSLADTAGAVSDVARPLPASDVPAVAIGADSEMNRAPPAPNGDVGTDDGANRFGRDALAEQADHDVAIDSWL